MTPGNSRGTVQNRCKHVANFLIKTTEGLRRRLYVILLILPDSAAREQNRAKRAQMPNYFNSRFAVLIAAVCSHVNLSVSRAKRDEQDVVNKRCGLLAHLALSRFERAFVWHGFNCGRGPTPTLEDTDVLFVVPTSFQVCACSNGRSQV
jgi:hypothetical protein